MNENDRRAEPRRFLLETVSLAWSLDPLEGLRRLNNLISATYAEISEAKVSQDTAALDIKALINKQVFRQANSGGRSTHYLLV